MYSPIPIKRSSKFGNNYWEHTALKLKGTSGYLVIWNMTFGY